MVTFLKGWSYTLRAMWAKGPGRKRFRRLQG